MPKLRNRDLSGTEEAIMAKKTAKRKTAAKAIQRNVEKTVRKSLREKDIETLLSG
jgi:hypothetical protein